MKKYILPFFLLIAGNAAGQKNLIVNGDFEKGNIGFKTEYNYANDKLAYGALDYFIHDNPAILRYQWAAKGKGKFMIVDGSDKGSPFFWQELLNVNPKKTYLLKLSLSALYNSFNYSRAEIGVFVNGKKESTIISPANENIWDESEILISQPASKSLEIKLVVMNPSWSGNDFGMDNISLIEVKKDYKIRPKAKTEITPGNTIEEGKIELPPVDMQLSVINVEGVKDEPAEMPETVFTSEKLQEEIVLVADKDLELYITDTGGDFLFSDVKVKAGQELKFNIVLKRPSNRLFFTSYSLGSSNMKIIVGRQSQTIELKAMQRRLITIKR